MDIQCLLEPVDDGLVQLSPVYVFKATIENHVLTSCESFPKNIVLWRHNMSYYISVQN